ncbi:MAG: histidinol-phosphatase HisJ family protein [Tissierellia bacterium]|nr:histidinol-phosphatase HisJ family protein [Tissierellia bacterium]
MKEFHCHSFFSGDSEEEPRRICETAIKKGITYLTITDHIDHYPIPSPNIFTFDVEKYFTLWKDLQKEYEKDLNIGIGVEIGLQPSMCEENDDFIEKYPFDFVIGSIHAVEGKDIYLDRFLEQYPPVEALHHYYDDMLYCVKHTKNFHILGHIDYIDRYFKDKKDVPDYKIFMPKIKEILQELIQTQRGIECNTAGLRKGLDHMNPKPSIIQSYYDLGGRIITIGADAHFAKDLGADYKKAVEIVKEIGFKKLSYFKNKEEEKIDF